MEKVVFFDRDGVINIDKHYLYRIEEFEFIEGTFEILRYLERIGYKLFIITNQSGISIGYYTIEQYNLLTNWIMEQFAKEVIIISGIYCCPHSPHENCVCRKPKIGMIKKALEIYDIDLKNSWLIGG